MLAVKQPSRFSPTVPLCASHDFAGNGNAHPEPDRQQYLGPGAFHLAAFVVTGAKLRVFLTAGMPLALPCRVLACQPCVLSVPVVALLLARWTLRLPVRHPLAAQPAERSYAVTDRSHSHPHSCFTGSQ
jgi:hypothetical protein